MIRILGIDPGTVVTGIGIIDVKNGTAKLKKFDTIVSKKMEPLPGRLKRIYDSCLEMIEKNKPDQFAIETAFYGKNIQSTLKLGQARGVAIIAALNCGLDIYEYSPREVKKSITGNGASSKHHVSYIVRSILNIRKEMKYMDETDALAVALCHHFRISNKINSIPLRNSKNTWSEFVKNNPEKIMGVKNI